MHKNIKTVAGCFTNVTCNVTATDGREVELTAYIAIGQERRPVPKAGAKLFAFPAVEYGQHLYEIRADGKPLIFGFLLVRPSAFPVAKGTVDYTLNATLDSVDALHVDIELTPGPRGYSAYEVAVMEGFVGSEAEWLEHMRQQTATMAVERVTPLMERAETAADKSEREAAAAKAGQETAAAHAKAAKESELAAAGHKTAAAAEVTKASAEVEKAKQERDTAAGHAAAAATSAQDALANKQSAEQDAQDAQTAKSGAEKAAANADASKSAAQTAEGNAKSHAAAAAADKAAAEEAKQDALAAKTKAEQEAQKAADNAALLGDAALKSGDNTFTGSNVFNGALSGNGTLCGMPFGSAFGAASMWQGLQITAAEFKLMFPNYAQMEVWPGFDNLSTDKVDNSLAGIKYVYCYMTMNYYEASPQGFPLEDAKEIVIFYASEGRSQRGYRAWAERNVFILPKAKDVIYDTGRHISLGCGTKMSDTFIYAPLLPKINFISRPYKNKGSNVVFLGNQVFKEITCDNGGSYPMTITGFNSPYCVRVRLTGCKLDKASILGLIGALPAYDEATMTAIPTCELYINPDLQGDAEVEEALLNLQTAVEDGGQGWTVAVTGITLGGAATFALRKVYYYARREDADGAYIDADGQRWDVSGGTTVLRNYEANEEVAGYSAFLSLDDALAEWGLHEITEEERKADYERRYGLPEQEEPETAEL